MKAEKLILQILSALFVCYSPIHAAETQQSADTIVVNAKAYSPPDIFAEAIAIKGNKIQAIGKRADIEKLAGENTQRIDANGATVTPAFNDSHVHMFYRAVNRCNKWIYWMQFR